MLLYLAPLRMIHYEKKLNNFLHITKNQIHLGTRFVWKKEELRKISI